MTGFPIWQVIIFLFIDFIIVASVVAATIFLILYLKTRKYKKTSVVNLNDLDAFKNKNLEMETNISLENSRPVAPSSFKSSQQEKNTSTQYTPPARIHNGEPQRMFNCQMQQTQQQMTDSFVMQQQTNNNMQQNTTNYFNM